MAVPTQRGQRTSLAANYGHSSEKGNHHTRGICPRLAAPNSPALYPAQHSTACTARAAHLLLQRRVVHGLGHLLHPGRDGPVLLPHLLQHAAAGALLLLLLLLLLLPLALALRPPAAATAGSVPAGGLATVTAAPLSRANTA